jgi:hypothetical protein
LSGKNASFKTDATMKRIDVVRLLSAFQNARGKMTGRMEGELKIAMQDEFIWMRQATCVFSRISERRCVNLNAFCSKSPTHSTCQRGPGTSVHFEREG